MRYGRRPSQGVENIYTLLNLRIPEALCLLDIVPAAAHKGIDILYTLKGCARNTHPAGSPAVAGIRAVLDVQPAGPPWSPDPVTNAIHSFKTVKLFRLKYTNNG